MQRAQQRLPARRSRHHRGEPSLPLYHTPDWDRYVRQALVVFVVAAVYAIAIVGAWR